MYFPEPCYCGAPDCPSCFPGSQDKCECAACGEEVRKWRMHDDDICENCHEEGFGTCECCGEIEILADEKQCAKCWIEELREALA